MCVGGDNDDECVCGRRTSDASGASDLDEGHRVGGGWPEFFFLITLMLGLVAELMNIIIIVRIFIYGAPLWTMMMMVTTTTMMMRVCGFALFIPNRCISHIVHVSGGGRTRWHSSL